MISTPSVPKTQEGAWLWMFKVFAGLMIIVILGIHLIVNHLVAPGGLLSYQDVVQYYTNPIIPIMEIFFLVFVVSHALVGVRSILLDLNPSQKFLRLVDIALTITGCVSVVYGIWLVLVIASKA
jgi:succinate dehydrogenase hydrophobic anchor subunit